MKNKLLIISLMMATLFSMETASAQQAKAEKDVAARVEQFREALLNPTREALQALSLPQLSYGHSAGKVEDQATFIETLVSGKSDFVRIELSDQHMAIADRTATVRHVLQADINDGGKPGTVKLHVLTVWVQQGGQWRLLARQAVKPAQ